MSETFILELDRLCRSFTGVTARADQPWFQPGDDPIYFRGKSIERAFVYLDRANHRLAFRSNAESNLEGMAMEVFDGYSASPHNWKSLHIQELQGQQLKGWLEESYRLAGMRNQGVESGETFWEVHPILKGPMSAAGEEFYPDETPHLGGPRPVLSGMETVGIALWCAEILEELVPAREQPEYLSIIETVRGFLKNPPESKTRSRYESKGVTRVWTHNSMMEFAAAKSKRCLGIQAARRAAGAASSVSYGKADNAFVNAKAAAIRVVKAYKAGGAVEAAKIKNFLTELDARILLAELTREFNRRWKDKFPPRFRRVLFRGVNEKGNAALWLARPEDDMLGLLYKSGRRFQWLTGPPDEILAHIPDDHFEAAAMAAL